MVPVCLAGSIQSWEILRERERDGKRAGGRSPPLGGADMALQTKVSGAWKHVRASTKVSGAWRDVPQTYVRVSGEWRPLYTFSWETGAWSECSATCGGGTQSRTVRAKRSDEQYFSDAIGIKFVGKKPDTSQTCNTHACSGCFYEEGKTYISWDTKNYGTSDYPFYGTWVYFYEDGNQIYQTFLTSGEGNDWTVDLNGCVYSFGDCVSCPGRNNIFKLCKSC